MLQDAIPKSLTGDGKPEQDFAIILMGTPRYTYMNNEPPANKPFARVFFSTGVAVRLPSVGGKPLSGCDEACATPPVPMGKDMPFPGMPSQSRRLCLSPFVRFFFNLQLFRPSVLLCSA